MQIFLGTKNISALTITAYLGGRGEYNKRALKHIEEGLDELRKAGNKFTGDVFSGKCYSLDDFNTKFLNGIGNEEAFQGFVSSSKLKSVAEGFIKETTKWAGDGSKVGLIRRIKSKNGVYIDDISDWGKNLGNKNHANASPNIQIQDEVLMNEGFFKQTSNPIPVMENGVHKVVDNIPYYYVDFVETLKPLK